MNVFSWLIDFGSLPPVSTSAISSSNHPPASCPRALPASDKPHLPNRCSRNASSSAARSRTLRMPHRVEILLRHLADAGNLADIQRPQELRLLTGHDPQHSMWLGLIGSNLGDQPRTGGADGAVEIGRGFDRVAQAMRGGERRTMQTLRARHVEIGFVDRCHFDARRELLQHCVHAARVIEITVAMAVDKDRLRAKFVGGAQRHRRMNAEFASRVAGRRNHAALVGLSADHDGLAFERWIVQLFDGDEEGVHVEMKVRSHLQASW